MKKYTKYILFTIGLIPIVAVSFIVGVVAALTSYYDPYPENSTADIKMAEQNAAQAHKVATQLPPDLVLLNASRNDFIFVAKQPLTGQDALALVDKAAAVLPDDKNREIRGNTMELLAQVDGMPTRLSGSHTDGWELTQDLREFVQGKSSEITIDLRAERFKACFPWNGVNGVGFEKLSEQLSGLGDEVGFAVHTERCR